MRKVLPDIISDSQKGFLKERYIGENTRLVYDVMSRLNQLDRKGLILLADFEKAFDSIEWYYINKVLVAYNFGSNFIKWFQILYNSACTSVINNGYLSESFFLHRGCRQGDPLSSYIFILAIEPLAMAIKSNVRIKGIKINGYQYKLGLYADDTFLLLDGSQMSLRESIKVFDNFFSCSGLKLNREKTELAWLGINNGEAICKDLNLKWVTSSKLLGINFLLDLDNMIQSNYQPVINKIENIISIYKARNLSLIGKIAVLKMIVIPKLVYTLSVLPSPTSNMFHHLEKLFRSFIWSNKTPKISMTELYKRVSKGGLRLTNLKCFNNALKLSWIKRFLIKDQQWQSLFEKTVGLNKLDFINLDLTSLVCKINEIKNQFWKDTFNAWFLYKSHYVKEIDVRTYPLWNSFVVNKNLLGQKDELYSKGLRYINDILNDTGEIMGLATFTSKFDIKTNFVDFYSLTHCLPQDWRAALTGSNQKLDSQNISQTVVTNILRMQKVCRGTYWVFVDIINKGEKKLSDKWSLALSMTISPEDMSTYFCANFKSTILSRSRSFQYQILQRSLVTNKFLKVSGINSNDNCTFCNSEVETLEHLFWRCQIFGSL